MHGTAIPPNVTVERNLSQVVVMSGRIVQRARSLLITHLSSRAGGVEKLLYFYSQVKKHLTGPSYVSTCCPAATKVGTAFLHSWGRTVSLRACSCRVHICPAKTRCTYIRHGRNEFCAAFIGGSHNMHRILCNARQEDATSRRHQPHPDPVCGLLSAALECGRACRACCMLLLGPYSMVHTAACSVPIFFAFSSLRPCTEGFEVGPASHSALNPPR